MLPRCCCTALIAAAVMIALGRQLKMIWIFAGTALIGLLALPPALSVTPGSRARWNYDEPERFHSLLFFERAVNLGSGVSPFVPVLILALIGGFWAWCQLRRVTFAERFWGPPMSAREPEWYRVLGNAVSDIFKFLAAVAGTVTRFLRKAFSPTVRFLVEQRGYALLKRKPLIAPEREGASDQETRTSPREQSEGIGTDAAQDPQAAAVPPGEVTSDQEARTPSANANTAQDNQAPSSGSRALYEARRPRQHAMFARLKETGELVDTVVRDLLPIKLLFWPPMLFAEAMAAVALFRLCERAIPSVDFRGHWVVVLMSIIWFLVFSVVISLGRFVLLWRYIDRITRDFLTLPMVLAYQRIPPMYAPGSGATSIGSNRRFTTLRSPCGSGRLSPAGFHLVSKQPSASGFSKNLPAMVSARSRTRTSMRPFKRLLRGTRTRKEMFPKALKPSRPCWRSIKTRLQGCGKKRFPHHTRRGKMVRH